MTEPLRVALVGCGKSKLAHPAPAQELYTGALFQKARTYAERFCDRWYVLSAKHGLLRPDRVIEPYDFTMRQRDPDYTRQWASLVDVSLRCDERLIPCANAPGGLVLVILAGADYARPLQNRLRHHSWMTLTEPMAGLGLGQRLVWLDASQRAG